MCLLNLSDNVFEQLFFLMTQYASCFPFTVLASFYVFHITRFAYFKFSGSRWFYPKTRLRVFCLNLCQVSTILTVLIVIQLFGTVCRLHRKSLMAVQMFVSATYSFAKENPIEPITKPNSKRRDMLSMLLPVSLSASSSAYLGKWKYDNKYEWISFVVADYYDINMQKSFSLS